ncbi:cytochrome c biogenesis CcdA family protein [Promicromonospora iranensis]|uniref:Cytochrome c biogenesis protein CcdA n=1 Tax=Promicromonospora iranensis TaxID=1105144 RepID=A0ABU2CKK2_9MICO|nr:cytochrome c biogenesis CcdA family protein [Promicromonospora iranensis]MDR7381849.1 cytochrome c biogenesis protein CcdA [Promicromonospora iranensis]
MDGLPLGLALAAGMVAVVNPCGFAMLPAYASMLVMGKETPGRAVAIRRALAFALAMTAGFTAVFGAFGLLLTLASSVGVVQRYLPWFTVVLGVVLIGLGAWLLAGRDLPGLRVAGVKRPTLTRSASSMAMFGVAYATASLSCTIAPFLATVVASFRAESVAAGLAVFGAYALGMGLVIVAVSLAVALAQTAVVAWLRKVGQIVPRLGGGLLLVAGVYVAYYGWYDIRVLRDGALDDPVIGAGRNVQRWLVDGVDMLGAGGMAAVVAVLLVLSVALTWWLRHRGRATGGRR